MRRNQNAKLLAAVFLTLVPTTLFSSTWYVDGVHGSDANNCKAPATACKTIGHAIALAFSGDTIKVAAATYTEHVTIGISLTITGASASTTIIDGGRTATVVNIANNSASVILSNLTIRHGFAFLSGGGIRNFGTLIINNSTISGNTSNCLRCSPQGGGIYNGGVLTINNSTISGNSAWCYHSIHWTCAGYGGGIYNVGNVLINNSTIVGNTVMGAGQASQGGGIFNADVVLINNSTLNGNGAVEGGGIYGLAWFQNSIVAGNGRGNCSRTQNSKGYNLSSDYTCNFHNNGDRNNTDPMLGTLGNYGGPTQTIPLLLHSPAIDAGNPSGCTDSRGNPLKTDQRGMPFVRPDKEDKVGCDIGAYERQSD